MYCQSSNSLCLSRYAVLLVYRIVVYVVYKVKCIFPKEQKQLNIFFFATIVSQMAAASLDSGLTDGGLNG